MGNISGKPHHKSRKQKQVRWKAADRPLPPGRPRFVSDAYSLPDVITLSWTPPKSDSGSPITGYLVEHRRCGSTHWIRSTPLLITIPEISLSGLDPGWRYQFRVSAENAVGMSMPSEISEPLTVTLQRSAVTAPQFTEELRDTVALENEKIEFVVHFMGQPTPKICWFKDGFEIFSSRRTRIITENNKSTLTIHQTALSDEGEIKCTATNRAGHASTRAILKLEAPPSIRLPRQYEEGLLFEIGELVRLKVSVAGRPSPLVFWSHNGESFKNDERHEIENGDRFSTLKINEVLRNDRGEYQVRAVNKLGEDFASFLVTITDKPSPPGRARVVMTLGRSVTLSWKSPVDDGGCKVGNYIVEYYRVGWNVWLKAATCRQLTTVLGDLIEGSEYRFRVKAESPYGISEPSEESESIFIPDPKRGIIGPRSRAKSQPPDLVPSEHISISYEPKMEPRPRSRSSSRTEKHVTISEITDVIPPVRPKRMKSKSAPQTPLSSPAISRRALNTNSIDKNMLDRASLARELAYGSPGMKTKKPEEVYNYHFTHESSTLKENSNEFGANNKRPVSPIVSSEVHISQEIQLRPSNYLNKPTSPSISQRPVSPNSENHLYQNQGDQQKFSGPITSKSVSPIENEYNKQRIKSPPREFQRIDSPRVESRQKFKSPPPKLPNEKVKSPSPSRKLVEERFNTITRDGHTNNSVTDPPTSSISSPQTYSQMHLTREFRSYSKSPSLEVIPRFGDRERQRSPNKLDFMGNSKDRDDTNTGSTEFMLVLLPNESEDNGSFSEIRFTFDDISVPPPLSLSAPELGSEPPHFEFLRSASSTDILRELQLRRVFESVALEEEEMKKRRNFQEAVEDNNFDIPKIQINSKDAEPSTLERVSSLRRRLSGGLLPSHSIVTQRRQSLRGAVLEEIPENSIHKFDFSLDNKRERLKFRQDLGSRESEEIEIDKARKKEKTESRKKEIAVIEEKFWDEESIENSDEELSISESNPSDEERFIEEKVPIRNVDEDEPIYHPGSIVAKPSDKEPFEILTKPFPLPDPNFIPKPILKKREDERYIPDKPIRKDLEKKLHTISQSVFPQDTLVEHKQRSSSPRPPNHTHFEKKGSAAARLENIPTIQESNLERNLSPEPVRRRESNEEIKTVTDHYGDILKSYSGTKKTTRQLYLDRDELKAAAEQQSTDNLEEIDNSIERLLVPDRKEFEGFDDDVTERGRTRSRTVSVSSDENESRGRSISQRRGSNTSPTNFGQRRNSNSLDPGRGMLRSRGNGSPRRKSLSKSPAHEENWSNLRGQRSPQFGRKASPSPQRRNSLTNAQAFNKTQPQQRKTVREITTQTSGYDDYYLPYPRVPTPEQEMMVSEAEVKVRSTIDYLTDLTMFFVACWLYLFYNELYAVPVLLVMVYRQLKEEILKRMPKWMLPKKKRKQRR